MIYDYQGRKGVGINWEVGIDTYTLPLYIKEIPADDLLK